LGFRGVFPFCDAKVAIFFKPTKFFHTFLRDYLFSTTQKDATKLACISEYTFH